MFGFGSAYADLLRPEDALREEEAREAEKRRKMEERRRTRRESEEEQINLLQVPTNARTLKKLSLTPLDEIPEVRVSLADEDLADLSRRKSYHGVSLRRDGQGDKERPERPSSMNLLDANHLQRPRPQRQTTEEAFRDNCAIRREWRDVFQHLDKADGAQDGLIDRKALVKWVSTLDLQKTIEFEANLNISPRNLERLVSKADHNKDGFVDQEEFLNLISNRDRVLSKKQQSLLYQYLKVAAYAEEYTCCPPPIFIIGITVIQISIYVYHIHHFLTHPDHSDLRVTWSGPDPVCSQLIYNPTRRYEAWRYLTYCFVHAGIQHILFNMLMQVFVGIPLEMSHGALRVAVVYAAGVTAGSLGTSVLDPMVFLAGASGGVYALIAAHLATLILNWQEDILIMRRRFRSGRAASAKHGHITRSIRLVTVLLYGVVDTGDGRTGGKKALHCLAIYNRHLRASPLPGAKTSYVAHLCGALAGLLIGIIVLKNRRVEHWETKLKVICVVLFAVLIIASVLWNFLGDSVMVAATGQTNATYFREESLTGGEEYKQNCHDFV